MQVATPHVLDRRSLTPQHTQHNHRRVGYGDSRSVGYRDHNTHSSYAARLSSAAGGFDSSPDMRSFDSSRNFLGPALGLRGHHLTAQICDAAVSVASSDSLQSSHESQELVRRVLPRCLTRCSPPTQTQIIDEGGYFNSPLRSRDLSHSLNPLECRRLIQCPNNLTSRHRNPLIEPAFFALTQPSNIRTTFSTNKSGAP